MSALPYHAPAAGQDRLLPLPRAAELLAPVSRWTALRKEQLLRAIALGMVTEAQVCEAHQVGADEIAMWRAELAHMGISGLRVCHGVKSGRRASHKRLANPRPTSPSLDPHHQAATTDA